MADLPILPLKTDALLADTTHLSAEEFGCYCRLLFVMWRQEAKLPDNEQELAAIAGVPLAKWKKMRDRVMRPMTVIGGIVSQKRMTATWMDVQELRRKRAEAAEKRWSSKRGPRLMQMHEQNPMQNDAIQNQTKITTSSFGTTSEGLQEYKPASAEFANNVKSLGKR